MVDRFAAPSSLIGLRHKGWRVGTLWSNDEIDGDVTLSGKFSTLNPVARADILKDVIDLLRREYEAALEEMEGQWERLRKPDHE